MTTHLVIPDSHAHPDHDHDRFELFGRLAVDVQPDVIIDIGDSADMPSLCSYDKGRREFEGRRYTKDIEAYHEAMERFLAPINAHNLQRKRLKKARYLPRLVKCRGNHEYRIARATSLDPVLDGKIGYADLKEEEYGWETYDYCDPVTIDGITYSHLFVSGVMGRPIGGVNAARTMLLAGHQSCTCGHLHELHFATLVQFNGKRIYGLNAGCGFDYHADYAGEANKLYWRGVVVKRDVNAGGYSPEFITLDALEKRYG